MIYLMGLLFIVILGGFICAIIEVAKNDYRRYVTAEDIENLGRMFDEEI